jgi:hypothetical protein
MADEKPQPQPRPTPQERPAPAPAPGVVPPLDPRRQGPPPNPRTRPA